MYKLGIDVGGTNTDAVLVDENRAVVADIKYPTSADIYDGTRSRLISSALLESLASFSESVFWISANFSLLMLPARYCSYMLTIGTFQVSGLLLGNGNSCPADFFDQLRRRFLNPNGCSLHYHTSNGSTYSLNGRSTM